MRHSEGGQTEYNERDHTKIAAKGGDMIFPEDLILVAVIKNKKDLEMAKVLGWYRIPMRFAPKVVCADVLAFYQTADFQDERWSIRYAARIQGVELVRRADLLLGEVTHPRANEEYYKIQLGPLEPLARSIPSQAWRRITFFYTTGEKLLAASEISELIMGYADRKIIWKALRDRSSTWTSPSYDPSMNPLWQEALVAFSKWMEKQGSMPNQKGV
jgi:hypothetical protein